MPTNWKKSKNNILEDSCDLDNLQSLVEKQCKQCKVRQVWDRYYNSGA